MTISTSTEELPLTPDLERRRDQAFPRFSDAQLARIARVAREDSFADGETLFERGAVDLPMFVVIDGDVEVVDDRARGPLRIISLGAGTFTGEVNLLRNTPALVRARAHGPVRALRVEQASLRELLQSDSEISDILLRAFMLRRSGLIDVAAGDAIVIGSQYSADTTRVRSFLVRNIQPYRYVDVDEDDDAQSVLDAFHVDVVDIPVLICGGDRVLRNPDNAETAECLGLNPSLEPDDVHDVVICGAGPGGLAAAVYAASEGMDTLVIEAQSPGGQAAGSSKIENYLGFPTGISGSALMVRALAQAEKFGAKVAVATAAIEIRPDGSAYRIVLSNGRSVLTRTAIIATGARYRTLDVPGRERFDGVGIYYSATQLEARAVGDEDVVVVGAANSAGQAASFLARSSRRVHVLVRGDGLASHMSRYLIRRLEATPNIELHMRTQVVALEGGDHLERITWRDDRTGATSAQSIRHLFSMAGADPNTQWLQSLLATDSKGFIVTGGELTDEQLAASGWTKQRRPLVFETSRPGIFAVGDVRASRIKRIASSVGEGSVCIQLVRQVLDE
jgi:thioredoxin reductase (NADPH)